MSAPRRAPPSRSDSDDDRSEAESDPNALPIGTARVLVSRQGKPDYGPFLITQQSARDLMRVVDEEDGGRVLPDKTYRLEGIIMDDGTTTWWRGSGCLGFHLHHHVRDGVRPHSAHVGVIN